MEVKQTKDVSDSEDQETAKKSGGKKSKKSKKSKVEDSDGDEATESVSTKQPSKPKRESRRKKSAADDSDNDDQLPAAPISAFALLQADDSDDDVGTAAVKSDIEDEAPKKLTKKKKSKKKEVDEDEDASAPSTTTAGKKSKKGKKKRGDSDEEDIDKMLAELQMEYDGGKKPDESKKDKKSVKDEEKPAKEVVEEEKTTSKKKKKKGAAVDEPAEPGKSQAPTVAPEDTKPSAEPTSADQPAAAGEVDAAAISKKKKGPGKAMVAAMQEALKKKKEDEERHLQIEEEKIRLLEEADRIRDEKEQLEREKKEKKKQKEKEKKERLKAEGKLLTAKQKADQLRAKAMLETLKASGVQMPGSVDRPVRPGTRIRPNKKQPQHQQSQESEKMETEETPAAETKVDEDDTSVKKTEEPPAPVEEIKDSWDVSSGEEEEEDTSEKQSETATETPAIAKEKEESGEESSEEEESEDEESEEDVSSDESDHLTEAQKLRKRAEDRIQKREGEAEKKRSKDVLRAAVVCVLGHVDTGKTKILDKLRRTNVQDGEAGGITQQIGATNVPIEAIKENTRHLQKASEFVFKIPGLLIIDTPGHESFSNLRSRGSSLCDIAILVVDIMHGLEPQTLESIELLKKRKTPFVVALNKIDRLFDWQPMPKKDIRDILKGQEKLTMQEFDKRSKEVIVEFAQQGLNAALFYENPDPRNYVSIVPTSAITGEGMGNLLSLVVQFSQNILTKRLMYSETLQSTVLEVKAIPGLGTTIDVILINGRLREGDTMILAGSEGPIVTQVKALLMPQPMKELRVKNAYVEHKEVMAAQGVKIAAKELEKAIAGLNMQIAQKPDEVEIYK